MKFDYSIIHTNDVDTYIYTGEVSGDLESAARSVLRERTDLLDDGFGDALAPTIEISRQADGTFIVDIDTHGLGEAGILLQKIS
jgi:hypothetical protein